MLPIEETPTVATVSDTEGKSSDATRNITVNTAVEPAPDEPPADEPPPLLDELPAPPVE